MTNNLPPRVVRQRGLTMVELSIVVLILLALVSMLFVGARAWKRGTDRASCILSIRNVQVAARSYQNLYGYSAGGRPYAENGTQNIAELLFAKGYIEDKLYQQARGTCPCHGGGIYSCIVPDVFPVDGQPYLTCSLSAADEHKPSSTDQW
jgi:prepilin-type N-terminal cleavage/methylation domain-containing protein